MAEVQQQLQDLKSKLDTESNEQYSDEERALVNKVERLKEEFRDLLQELRRKRASDGSCVLSDDVGTVFYLIYHVCLFIVHVYLHGSETPNSLS